MRDKVLIVYLQFTDAHEQSGLEALKTVGKRLWPERETYQLVIDNSDKQNIEIKAWAEHLDRISGDNSAREFSGYDKGVRYFESCGMIDSSTLVVFANDTFHRNYGAEYLTGFTRTRLNEALDRNGILGYVDAFPEPVSLGEMKFQKWVRSSFFILKYETLKRLMPLNAGIVKQSVFRDDSAPEFFKQDAPLSENYKKYLRTWLFETAEPSSEFQHEWHSKKPLSDENLEAMREKTVCILCEHSFSAKAQLLGIPIVASNYDSLPQAFR